jgi:hypothetical protein
MGSPVKVQVMSVEVEDRAQRGGLFFGKFNSYAPHALLLRVTDKTAILV